MLYTWSSPKPFLHLHLHSRTGQRIKNVSWKWYLDLNCTDGTCFLLAIPTYSLSFPPAACCLCQSVICRTESENGMTHKSCCNLSWQYTQLNHLYTFNWRQRNTTQLYPPLEQCGIYRQSFLMIVFIHKHISKNGMVVFMQNIYHWFNSISFNVWFRTTCGCT